MKGTFSHMAAYIFTGTLGESGQSTDSLTLLILQNKLLPAIPFVFVMNGFISWNFGFTVFGKHSDLFWN